MPISIHAYTEDRIPAVREFNRRLAAGGVDSAFHFPESHVPLWLPPKDSRPVYQNYFLAVDGESIRGGFILKYQPFLLRGRMQTLPYYHLPVSEGIVDKKFSALGAHMLRTALKMQPALFCLGMGGADRPLPRMLEAMRWTMAAVPFCYKVNHPAPFLREIAPLRTSFLRRIVSQTAAATGMGWLGLKALHSLRSTRIPRAPAEIVPGFGSWADALWSSCSTHYAMIGQRDAITLNLLYPADKHVIRLRIGNPGRGIGWALLLDTQMTNNKYFGNLRVGSIADCLAAPEDAACVIAAATGLLEDRGVDLVIANHSHSAWRAAFRSAGFFEGPSNFLFAASPALADQLQPHALPSQIYFNRGDGDGPVNL